MHEAALARQILDAVLAQLPRGGTSRVRVVRGSVAQTEALAPESLALHFSSHARGTAAEGARLELRLVHVQARCGACGGTYLPEHHLLLCPACGATDATLLGQTGLRVDTIDVD